jgi:hypothetical protein
MLPLLSGAFPNNEPPSPLFCESQDPEELIQENTEDRGTHGCLHEECHDLTGAHYITEQKGVTGEAFRILTRQAQELMRRADEAMRADVQRFLESDTTLDAARNRGTRKRKYQEDYVRIFGDHLDPKVMGFESPIWQTFARRHYPPHKRAMDTERDAWPDERIESYIENAGECCESWRDEAERTSLVLELSEMAVNWGLSFDVVCRTMEALDTLIMTPDKLKDAFGYNTTLLKVIGTRNPWEFPDPSEPKPKNGFRILVIAMACLHNFSNGAIGVSCLARRVQFPCITDMLGDLTDDEKARAEMDEEDCKFLHLRMEDFIKNTAKDLRKFCTEMERMPTVYGVALDMCTLAHADKEVVDAVKVLCYMLYIAGMNSESFEGPNQRHRGILWAWPDKHTTAAGLLLMARYRLHKKTKWDALCKSGSGGLSYSYLRPVVKRIHVRTATMPRKVNFDWRRVASELLGVASHVWGLVDLKRHEASSYKEINFTDSDDETQDGNSVDWRYTMPKLPY